MTTATTEKTANTTSESTEEKAKYYPLSQKTAPKTRKPAAKTTKPASKPKAIKETSITNPAAEKPLDGQAQFPEFIKDVPQILDHEKLAAQLAKTTTYIRREVGNVAKSFCRIGFKLWEAREQKQYLGHEGFKNVYDYAECALGFKKATTANYIAVCERFSVHGEDGKPTMELLPNFVSFSYTQLTEMLPLPDAKLEDVNPDMTCKEIREIKNAAKDEDSCDNDGDSGSQTKTGGKSRGRKENISLFCHKLTWHIPHAHIFRGRKCGQVLHIKKSV